MPQGAPFFFARNKFNAILTTVQIGLHFSLSPEGVSLHR